MAQELQPKRFDTFGGMFKLILPIFIELLLQVLVGNIDQMMLSNYMADSVGAVANANAVLNVFMLVFTMVSLATTILASQYMGAKQQDKVEEVYSVSVFMNIALGVVISILLVTLREPLFRLMRLDERFMKDASEYMLIVGGFSFLQSLYLTYTAIFRSKRMMNITMFVSMAVNILNMGLNYLLIFGIGPFPRMGVAGAAMATVISRAAGVIALMALMRRKVEQRVRLRYLRPFPKAMLGRLLAIGLPGAGESFSYHLSQTVLLAVINGFGANATNAKAYCAVIVQFSFLYCIAASQAAQICVGYHVGAREYDKARRLTKRLVFTSMLISVFCAVMIYLFRGTILTWFDASEVVALICGQILLVDIFVEFGRSYNSVYIRALQGAGDIRYPVAIGIIFMWVISVGLGYLLGVVCGLGVWGVWLAMAIDECVRGLIFVFRWRSGVWMRKGLV